MPEFDSQIHVRMLESGKRTRRLTARLKKAFQVLVGKDDIYGLEWGDPDNNTPLSYVKDRFLLPYINPNATVLEIGAGGGRWTRYMGSAKRIYAVDYHEPVLEELKSNIKFPHLKTVKNNGCDFPGVPPESIDLVFSFGCFVHLEIDTIESYLKNMKPLLHAKSNVVIQYSDKTKPIAAAYDDFGENDPSRMKSLIEENGYRITETDDKTLWHSAIVRFAIQ